MLAEPWSRRSWWKECCGGLASLFVPDYGDESDTGDSVIRARALERIERTRRVKFHLAAYAAGVIVLGGWWLAIEYLNAGGSTILFVLVVWGLLLAIHGLRIYYRRPATEGEVRRASERLRRA